jgi:serine/threonine protein kinase
VVFLGNSLKVLVANVSNNMVIFSCFPLVKIFPEKEEAMPNLTGQSIGRYHILEQLGEGGMATVYKAYDTRLERNVAVKVLRTDQFIPAQLQMVLQRFEREAKSLARLSNPNIVNILDFGEHEGMPYLVMEYLPGGTLKQKMGHAIPWQTAIHTLLPVAHGLAYAHQHGVIHRDVKPANILLSEAEMPILTDFGIAKLLEAGEGHTLTGSGVGIGTPEYMAPEQGIGASTIDERADIYSLGIVLYEMVTGRKPYIADTPMAVVLKQMTDPLPRPTEFVPDLPEGVEHILLKA